VTPEPPITIYVAIGNDSGLSQTSWIKYHDAVAEELIRGGGRILADWYSLPTAHWTGCCFWVEIHAGIGDRLQETLTEIARAYGQPRITWAEVLATTSLR
jgi:hypothetical protein